MKFTHALKATILFWAFEFISAFVIGIIMAAFPKLAVQYHEIWMGLVHTLAFIGAFWIMAPRVNQEKTETTKEGGLI